MALMEAEKQQSSGCKNGCAGVGNVAPSKVTEKYKRNKYHEVNYCYGEGESAYSARTAHPFQRNGAPFRFKLSKAQQVD